MPEPEIRTSPHVLEVLDISSPKKNGRPQTHWEGFFPYYAGYSETFARALLTSAKLPRNAVVLDPWNGSGTTTYTASQIGLSSRGFDLNPVMVIVARARLLPASEADSVEPLARDIIRCARSDAGTSVSADPLKIWFGSSTADFVRALERSIRHHLIGAMTNTPSGVHFERISGLAATFYVALFGVCREIAAPFQSSNPTWLRLPHESEARAGVPREAIARKFLDKLARMTQALTTRSGLAAAEAGVCEVRVSDTTTMALEPGSIDFVLTSPPYCTRIDYTAATRIELALLSPMLTVKAEDLSRQMIGSTRVPTIDIDVSPTWGTRCAGFLQALQHHPSRASSGYYYRTHLDYFYKMERSLGNIASGLRKGGLAVMVVQDSYYKDIHNDLPSIVTDIAESQGLALTRREDFQLVRTMAGVNKRTRLYRQTSRATEAVLCLQKV